MSVILPPISPSAHFVWGDSSPKARNSFVLFRKDFELASLPHEAANLYLFADTRYRLWVNGEFVSAGPARFVIQFPEYDTIDLSPFLKVGKNVLVVEVNFYGCSSYQTMPGSRGGFIAWGGAGDCDFATPGNWQQRPLDAWDAESTLISFAQGACEILDTRKLESAWYGMEEPMGSINEGWKPVDLLKPEEMIWGELKERSVPACPLDEMLPIAVETQGELKAEELLYGVHFPDHWMGEATSLPIDQCLAFSTWIFSPVAQTIALGHYWGNHWLNGLPIKAEPTHEKPGTGMRMSADVELHQGWNVLCGHLVFLTSGEFWDFLIGVPAGKGLRLAAAMDDAADSKVFNVSPLISKDEIAKWIDNGQPVENTGWLKHDGDWRRITPARVVGWKRLKESSVKRKLPMSEVEKKAPQSGGLWVFDFGEEYLGHVEITLEGPEGLIVDVGYDEWLSPDGRIDLYRTNPFVHTVERYILRGGRQTLLGVNPRGGRFLQVLVHAHDEDHLCQIHKVAVRSTRTLSRGDACFRSNDALLEKIWYAGVMTLIGSTEDAYSDSPWRERGTYIGDFTVNQMVHQLLSGDMRVARRALRVFAQAKLPDGQIPAAAPSYLRRAHEDFTLIWVIGAYEHWAMTGDTEVIKEIWPSIEGVWASPAWGEPDAHGLWHGEGKHIFIDWGVLREDRTGTANAVLNAFRIAALDASAKMAGVLGMTDDSSRYADESAKLRESFAAVLWIEKEGRYAACIDAKGCLSTSPAIHANVLAWAFQIGTSDQLSQLETYVMKKLAENFDHGLKHGQFGGHLEIYFFRYFLNAMAERGHGKFAVDLVRQHWGYLVEDSFGTLSECFCRRDIGKGSRCHSWSAFPSVFFHRYVLGLRQVADGDINNWVLDPVNIVGIDSAEGVMAHPRGWIKVNWSRNEDQSLITDISAPEGVIVKT